MVVFAQDGILLFVLAASAAGQDYGAWDRALHAHVTPGLKDNVGLSIVDYGAMAVDPDFQAFIGSLAYVRPEALGEQAWKALFINAYNAFAIHMVIDHACHYGPQNQCLGPLQSVGDVGNAKGDVWKMPAGNIGGQSYTLQHIEDLLRSPPAPFRADPRIHACINCASVSCPNLRNEAYQTAALDAQMDEQMRIMVNNPQKGMRLDQGSNSMTLSAVFDWNRVDFERASQSVPAFVSRFLLSEQDRAYIAAYNPQLGYFPWDRNLNGEAPCSCPGSPVFT